MINIGQHWTCILVINFSCVSWGSGQFFLNHRILFLIFFGVSECFTSTPLLVVRPLKNTFYKNVYAHVSNNPQYPILLSTYKLFYNNLGISFTRGRGIKFDCGRCFLIETKHFLYSLPLPSDPPGHLKYKINYIYYTVFAKM